jgi:hypothetical protein
LAFDTAVLRYGTAEKHSVGNSKHVSEISFIYQCGDTYPGGTIQVLRTDTVAAQTLDLLKDIAAMKLSAITNRGTRRDFIDIYFLLRYYTLQEQLEFYTSKYPQGSIFDVVRSLTYFTDAEAIPIPKMLVAVEWGEVKRVIRNAVADCSKARYK